MKKLLSCSTVFFSLLIPVLVSAQLLEYINIPETYTTSETILLVIIPVIGVFIIIWSILSKITVRRLISAIISIIVTVALMYFGYISSLVTYLVSYLTNLGMAGIFIVASVIFLIWNFRTIIRPMSLTRAIAAKYRAAGSKRRAIIGEVSRVDNILKSKQEQKSRLETERNNYSLVEEDLSGYIKRGDLPTNVWQEVQRKLGRSFLKPSNALKWLSNEIRRRDDAISRLEIEITRLKSKRAEKTEKLKKEV